MWSAKRGIPLPLLPGRLPHNLPSLTVLPCTLTGPRVSPKLAQQASETLPLETSFHFPKNREARIKATLEAFNKMRALLSSLLPNAHPVSSPRGKRQMQPLYEERVPEEQELVV